MISLHSDTCFAFPEVNVRAVCGSRLVVSYKNKPGVFSCHIGDSWRGFISVLTLVLYAAPIAFVLKKPVWPISLLLVCWSQAFKPEVNRQISLFNLINGCEFE